MILQFKIDGKHYLVNTKNLNEVSCTKSQDNNAFLRINYTNGCSTEIFGHSDTLQSVFGFISDSMSKEERLEIAPETGSDCSEDCSDDCGKICNTAAKPFPSLDKCVLIND